MKKLTINCFVANILILLSLSTYALADNDSGDYVPLPPGTMLMATYFNHISATNSYRHGKKVSNDTDLSANIGVIRPVYFTKIDRFTIDPQVIIPFGEQSVHINGTGGENSNHLG